MAHGVVYKFNALF